MDKTLIVMPYYDGGKQGRELEMTLTGWKKFCKFPFKIAIVGDRNPVIDKFEFVEWVPCPRVQPIEKQYHPHIDMVNKFLKAYSVYHEEYKDFWYICDDEYPIHDFDKEFLSHYYYLQPNFTGDMSRPTYTWQHDLAKTAQLLRRKGLPTINFTTHFPQYFEFEKLKEIIDKFNMTTTSYVIENLYCNYYKIKPGPLVDTVRFGNWSPKDSERILDEVLNNPNEKRKFLACSTKGFNPTFQNKLCKYLGI